MKFQKQLGIDSPAHCGDGAGCTSIQCRQKLPPRAASDAAHLAIAAIAKADYLLTWNCRHLANVQILQRLEIEALRLAGKDDLAREAGYDVHRFFENLRKWEAEHPHPGPVARSAEELRQLLARKERERAEQSAIALNDKPPRNKN